MPKSVRRGCQISVPSGGRAVSAHSDTSRRLSGYGHQYRSMSDAEDEQSPDQGDEGTESVQELREAVDEKYAFDIVVSVEHQVFCEE